MDYAFASRRIRVDSMESDYVTFAGPGEPLLELAAITEACEVVRAQRHGQRFRVITSGLVPKRDQAATIEGLLVRAFVCVCARGRSGGSVGGAGVVQK